MAPNARYFVLFASKHPQITQIQEDAKDLHAAAIRYLEKNVKALQELDSGGGCAVSDSCDADKQTIVLGSA